ncbi:hypothetical protein UC35_14945 [Ramlibacter tataouinensis]|uniref:GAF domain-containing protein n=1 Tax=Ramlibacter tataouinensis TaxID=94132 RepID=A0A127K0H3_9BURK|nr:hypothetical protein UC35_14945 [Ramlibacter tataouinensis]
MAYPRLSGNEEKQVGSKLQALRQDAARILSYNVDNVRVNFFGLEEGVLRPLAGLSDNMTYAPELTMEIRRGQGGTGTAYESGEVCVLSKTGATWSGNNLPTDELTKVHPALGWVISLPVESEGGGPPLGVVNVDGLGALPPVLQDENSEQFELTMVILKNIIDGSIQPDLQAAYWAKG